MIGTEPRREGAGRRSRLDAVIFEFPASPRRVCAFGVEPRPNSASTRRGSGRGGRGERAFTLIEVLVTITLVLALSGSLFTFLVQIVDSRAIALSHMAVDRAANTLIDRVEVDLAACIMGGGANGSGVKGDNQTLRILTRSVPASLAERGREDPDILGDLQLSEYRFVEGAGRIEARRTPLGRRPDRGAAFQSLGGEIHAVRFRYHDGTDWRDSFDSLAADRLPAAIEIAIWYRPWEEEEEDPYGEDGAFDETEFDAREDPGAFEPDELDGLFEDLNEPPPDRVRVIVIPDSEGEDASDEDELDRDADAEFGP